MLGTVDTDPQPVAYGLPPVLQSGTVLEKLVKDGDAVKAGQPLYSFDATLQQANVESAKATVTFAKTKVKEAEELAKQHTATIKFTRESALGAAKRKVELNRQLHNLIKKNLEDHYKRERIPEAEWPEKLKIDTTLYKANVDYDTAVGELDVVEAKLRQLEAADPQVQVKEAEAAVKQAEVAQANAQKIVDLCVVKAKTDGTVEQVTISPGATLGIGTRTPALWLIPAMPQITPGEVPRVIRAELEAEFAHRVGPDRVGKTVTVSDHSDAKLTYTGTIRHIGGAFLLKRASGESLLGGDTRVIEVLIDVANSAPEGKPPLRVGQRVRVNLGQ